MSKAVVQGKIIVPTKFHAYGKNKEPEHIPSKELQELVASHYAEEGNTANNNQAKFHGDDYSKHGKPLKKLQAFIASFIAGESNTANNNNIAVKLKEQQTR